MKQRSIEERVRSLGGKYVFFGSAIPIVGWLVLLLERIVGPLITTFVNWIVNLPALFFNSIFGICFGEGTPHIEKTAPPPPPSWGVSDLETLGICFMAALLWIVMGIGLKRLRPWARTAALIFSVCSTLVLLSNLLFGFLLPSDLYHGASILTATLPFGIALRIYTVVVLGNAEAAALFPPSNTRLVRRAVAPPAVPPAPPFHSSTSPSLSSMPPSVPSAPPPSIPPAPPSVPPSIRSAPSVSPPSVPSVPSAPPLSSSPPSVPPVPTSVPAPPTVPAAPSVPKPPSVPPEPSS